MMDGKSGFRPGIYALALVVCSAIATGCGTDDGAGNPESRLSAEEAAAELPQGAAPELTALRDQANELLDGGADAFESRLRELKGIPVVVNKWASWCGPCRLEFPLFQEEALARGAEVAFLGIDTTDNRDTAETFLAELPLPYPSYYDPDSEIAEMIGAPKAFPATAFYASSGERVFTYQGGYRSREDLAADIERYAR